MSVLTSIDLAKFAVDDFHLEHLVAGQLRLREQHLHLVRHAPTLVGSSNSIELGADFFRDAGAIAQ